jgi:hypothetical protein
VPGGSWGGGRFREGALDGVLLGGEELSDAVAAEIDEGIELGGIKRGFFAAGLEFDELVMVGHDEVHVDLGDDVLGVAEVQERGVVDEPDADGSHGVEQGVLGDLTRLEQAMDREGKGDIGAGDGGGAGAPIGLEDITIDPDRAGSELGEVQSGAERTADETLDFLGSAIDATAGAVARFTLESGVGEHCVFGGNPAAGKVLFFHPAGNRILDGDAAEHPGITPFDERGTEGVRCDVVLEPERADLIGLTTIGSWQGVGWGMRWHGRWRIG